jgi:hypothetical protein
VTISTDAEGVERLAEIMQDKGDNRRNPVGDKWSDFWCGDAAATLRALLAERDAARADAARMREALRPTLDLLIRLHDGNPALTSEALDLLGAEIDWLRAAVDDPAFKEIAP